MSKLPPLFEPFNGAALVSAERDEPPTQPITPQPRLQWGRACERGESEVSGESTPSLRNLQWGRACERGESAGSDCGRAQARRPFNGAALVSAERVVGLATDIFDTETFNGAALVSAERGTETQRRALVIADLQWGRACERGERRCVRGLSEGPCRPSMGPRL